jgi:hypothetical protein
VFYKVRKTIFFWKRARLFDRSQILTTLALNIGDWLPDLVVVLLEVELLDLPLEIFQVVPQLVEDLEEGLAALVDDVDPAVEVGQQALQVLQLRQALLVLTHEPFGAWGPMLSINFSPLYPGQGCQIFCGTIYKKGNIYQMTTNNTKVPQNIPNGRKNDQMAIKYTNILHCKTRLN